MPVGILFCSKDQETAHILPDQVLDDGAMSLELPQEVQTLHRRSQTGQTVFFPDYIDYV